MREFKLKSIHRTIIKTIHTLGQNVTRKQIYDHLISINHKSPHSYSKKCICDVLEKHGYVMKERVNIDGIPGSTNRYSLTYLSYSAIVEGNTENE